MYKEISREEALNWLDFNDAAERWEDLYQCTYDKALNEVINKVDDRLIMRLGAFAKDKGRRLNISMSFRPSSYQEMLAARNGGKWNAQRVQEGNDYIENLKAWYGVNTAVCAYPGCSNHNTGAAADANSYWFKAIKDGELKPYGLTKNVAGEWWHVCVIELAAINGYDRVRYAFEKGYEPEICPCKDRYVSGRYIKYGASVWYVQEKLKELGFLKTTPDGQFGPNTKNAVKAFQAYNGLTADGICGRDTIDAMLMAKPKEKNVYERILKKGDKGEDVKTLQSALFEKGYGGNMNKKYLGEYGSKTVSAVKSYQRAMGLKTDGIAGKETIEALGGVWNGN